MYFLQSEPENPILSLILLAAAVVGIYYLVNQRKKKLAELKQAYDEALSGTDKKRALEAGRAYYAFLRRKNILTVYDEQAISNDLQSMDHARVNN